MSKSYYRGGHCPGHIRDTFLAAVEAYRDWKPGNPEPTVELEIGYVPRPIPISAACGLVWRCTDILPSLEVSRLALAGIDLKRRTYAAAAQALKPAIREAKTR